MVRMTQKDYDKISHLTEQDFITIMTAAVGGVDWEFMAMLYAHYEYEQAIQMCKGGWCDAVDRHQGKADKIMNFINTFRKMNCEK